MAYIVLNQIWETGGVLVACKHDLIYLSIKVTAPISEVDGNNLPHISVLCHPSTPLQCHSTLWLNVPLLVTAWFPAWSGTFQQIFQENLLYLNVAKVFHFYFFDHSYKDILFKSCHMQYFYVSVHDYDRYNDTLIAERVCTTCLHIVTVFTK